MKRKLLTITIIVILLGIFLSGCFEKNNQNHENEKKGIVTESVVNLLLSIEDLPENCSLKYKGMEYTSEFSRYPEHKPIQYYKIEFSKGNISDPDDYELILCELNKFDSIEKAEIGYNTTLEYIITTGNFDVMEESINIIGNESKALTKENYREVLTFRISNVIGVMSSNSLSYTIELAQIVEQRIYDSIN